SGGLENCCTVHDLTAAGSAGNTFRPRKMLAAYRVIAGGRSNFWADRRGRGGTGVDPRVATNWHPKARRTSWDRAAGRALVGEGAGVPAPRCRPASVAIVTPREESVRARSEPAPRSSGSGYLRMRPRAASVWPAWRSLR